MSWQITKNGTKNLVKKFATFDQAWEFMTFLAKLSRSLGLYPKIVYENLEVEVEIVNNLTNKSYEDGVVAYLTDGKTKNVVSGTAPQNTAFLYTDGGSRGNPGPSASGFVLLDENQNEIARGGKFLGVTTNNQAEYHSLKMGIEKARELRIKSLKVHMDSMLVVNQINGTYKVRNRDLWPIYESIKLETSRFTDFQIVHIPRELNRLADSIVNEILDESTS